MKNKKLFLALIASVLFIVCSLAFIGVSKAACTITNKKGVVIFSCKGEDGRCVTEKFGYTLSCTGLSADESDIDLTE